jgi:hypothetical protein
MDSTILLSWITPIERKDMGIEVFRLHQKAMTRVTKRAGE